MASKLGDYGNKFGEKLRVCKYISTWSSEKKGSLEVLVTYKINSCNCKVLTQAHQATNLIPCKSSVKSNRLINKYKRKKNPCLGNRYKL